MKISQINRNRVAIIPECTSVAVCKKNDILLAKNRDRTYNLILT